MTPGPRAADDFDIIAVPAHDNLIREAKNIIRITGVPHNVDPEQLSRESLRWSPEFSRLKTPIVGLIVGGATKRRPFTQKMVLTISPARVRSPKRQSPSR